MMPNYKVFFIAGGNAAFNEQQHNATLPAMAHTFRDTIDTDTMSSAIAEARTPALA